LEKHLRRDPSLLARRFTLREIYPLELGCANDERSGMHWTPIAGTTLLHLSIDFAEKEIFDWLLAHGADVNARATIDADGFGGHTPLFHTVVCGPRRDTAMLQALLERGASTDARASLRKFLDWCENPRWYEARNVTALEWGGGFPDKMWVNAEALRLLD
jgi:ankyrin repeat protein